MSNDIEKLMVKVRMLIMGKANMGDYTPDHVDDIHSFLVVFGYWWQDWLNYYPDEIRSQQ